MSMSRKLAILRAEIEALQRGNETLAKRIENNDRTIDRIAEHDRQIFAYQQEELQRKLRQTTDTNLNQLEQPHEDDIRLPSQQEIIEAFKHPHTQQKLLSELDKRFAPQPAARPDRPQSGKWFGNGDRIPSMEDMKDPIKLAEILKEVDSLFVKR